MPNSAKTPSEHITISGTKVRALRKAKGLKQLLLATKASLSLATIKRIERTDHISVKAETASSVAEALEVELSEIEIRDNNGPKYRDVSGPWHGRGEDVEVPGHLMYEKPVRYEIEFEIEQTGAEFTCLGEIELFPIGSDQLVAKFPFSAFGQVMENNFLIAHITNESKIINGYGTIFYHIAPDGQSMRGYILGRDKGQVSSFHFVFGMFEIMRGKRDD